MAWEDADLRPDGVNLGGWFCLEDWFFSQDSGKKAHVDDIIYYNII